MSYGNFASNYNNPMADLGNAVAGARNKAGGVFSKFYLPSSTLIKLMPKSSRNI